ncbi:MAG: hypothetical protein Kow00121_26900 [Elainellaceae cyanobacterium]
MKWQNTDGANSSDIMTETIRVITHVTALSGKEVAAKTLLKELVEATRTEPGCLDYELLQSSVAPNDFVLVEEWQSDAAFNAHMMTPQVQEALLEGEMLLASPPDVRRYKLV